MLDKPSKKGLSCTAWWEVFSSANPSSYPELMQTLLTTVSGRKKRLSEEAEDYPFVIANLDGEWRIILCRDGIQWILQQWYGGRWRPRKYCRTLDALLRGVRGYGITLDDDAIRKLNELPAKI